MASVLVDLEDISYIDDITDEEVINTEEEYKAKKRRKNRLLGEQLKIDPNNKLVKELREERQESKKVSDIMSKRDQTSRDFQQLHAILKDQEKQKIIQDLRDERAKLNSDPIEEINEPQDETDEKGDSLNNDLCQSKHYKMTKENKEKMNKDTGNKDIKRKSNDNPCSDIENTLKSNQSETYANEENEAMLENTAEFYDDTDSHKQEGTESGETHHNFSDKSKLVKTDSKSELRSRAKRQKPSGEGKENVKEVKTDTDGIKDEKMMANGDNEKDTTRLLKSNFSDNDMSMEIPEKTEFNGAKPKLFTKRVNGHDMKLMELNLELYPTNESAKKSGKGKGSRKKKTKAMLEAPEQNIHSAESDIKILVTDVEGTEVVAHMSESTTGTSRETWSSTQSNTNDQSSPSDATTTSHTSKSTALNYLRKMSEDHEGKKSNLLAQAELYKQQKAKPFQKFSKTKGGLFSAGIEGDSRRSYIKSMAMMPDKKLIMFDKKNMCLKLFDKDFNPLDKVSLTTKYCGLAIIFDETFAATLPSTKKLQFYHVDNDTNKICRERTHPVEGEFYSITYHHHRIYLIHRIRTLHFTDQDEWEVKKVNINKNTEEMKTIRKFSPGHKDCNLLATDQGIYLTNRLENEVLMLRHDGKLLNRHKVCNTPLYLVFTWKDFQKNMKQQENKKKS